MSLFERSVMLIVLSVSSAYPILNKNPVKIAKDQRG
jgi:hypothetical protein